MKVYDITITETLEKKVFVKAASAEEAEEKVRQGYYNSEYVLDADNFTQVEFKTGEGWEIGLEGSKINVLLVRPEEFPRPFQVGTEVEDLQAAVGGNIRLVCPFEAPVVIICNEEGKLNGLPLNRALRDEDGRMYDILAGDFLVVGLSWDDFGSLTPEEMDKYEKLFHSPEVFVKMGQGVLALPLDDETVKKRASDREVAAVKPLSPVHETI